MPHLRYEIENNLATMILCNPPQNRLTPQMLEEMASALRAIGSSGARVMLVRAEGPDFCFGGDIVPWPEMSRHELRTLFEHYMNTFNQFERLAIPTIVAVQGLCFGGGLELAIRADVVFAAETSRFGHPEQSLGIITVLGGIYRIAERVGRARAMEWSMTSDPVPAKVMERFGVINHIVSDGELLDEAKAFADKIATGPTLAYAAHKALLRLWASGGPALADEAMWDIAMPLFETADVKGALPAAVSAYLEGRPRERYNFQGN